MPAIPFLQFLPDRLQRQLPGWPAQVGMAPSPGHRRQPPQQASDDVRRSAVLLLLYPRAAGGSSLDILLTRRSRHLNHHRGQISFPGGRIEAGETRWRAALREAAEEVDLPSDHVKFLGELSSLYVPVSNNVIFPMIAHAPERPLTTAQPDEVEEVLSVAIDDLLNPEKLKRKREVLGGRSIEYPYWDVHPSVPLWGATAMILNELVDLYREYLAAAKL